MDVFLKIDKDLPRVELLHLRVRPNTGLHGSLLFQNGQTLLYSQTAAIGKPGLLLNFNGAHAPKEYFEHGLHIIHEHLLKILFLLVQLWIFLLLPHFVDDTFINVPILNVRQKILKELIVVF